MSRAKSKQMKDIMCNPQNWQRKIKEINLTTSVGNSPPLTQKTEIPILKLKCWRSKEPKPTLSPEQFNQRRALAYFIRITAHHDSLKREVVNTCTVDDNIWFLNETFGFTDTAVFPSYAFDGCVLKTQFS